MRVIPIEQSNFVLTAIVSLVTISSLVLLSLVLAYWSWNWLAPRPEPRAQAAARAESRLESAFNLFGNAEQSRNEVAATDIAIRLLGIVAATQGSRGYAIVQFEANKILAIEEGNEIVPGILLEQVDTDHIILERGGTRTTLAWPEKKVPAGPAPL